MIDNIQQVELTLRNVTVNNDNLLSSYYTEVIHRMESTEQVLNIYNPELNDGIVSALSDDNELNNVDNTAAKSNNHTNEDTLFLPVDVVINEGNDTVKFRKVIYDYNKGLPQKV